MALIPRSTLDVTLKQGDPADRKTADELVQTLEVALPDGSKATCRLTFRPIAAGTKIPDGFPFDVTFQVSPA